jgi:hypothetical protein
LFLAQSICQYPVQDIATAVLKLNHGNAIDVMLFLRSVSLLLFLLLRRTYSVFYKALDSRLTSDGEQSRLLAIQSAIVASRQLRLSGYQLRTRPRYHFEAIGNGSFGKVYRGSELNICVKVMKIGQVDSGFKAVRLHHLFCCIFLSNTRSNGTRHWSHGPICYTPTSYHFMEHLSWVVYSSYRHSSVMGTCRATYPTSRRNLDCS